MLTYFSIFHLRLIINILPSLTRSFLSPGTIVPNIWKMVKDRPAHSGSTINGNNRVVGLSHPRSVTHDLGCHGFQLCIFTLFQTHGPELSWYLKLQTTVRKQNNR